MPVIIVVGVQWGDEGKGKVVDYVTERANLVVRFQGGNNAGHTIIVEGRRTALRLIPSGILRNSTRCLLAAGMVLDPEVLLAEFEGLREVGIEVEPHRLGLAGEINLILPYHRAIDVEREQALGEGKIGTTGKGIGPAYEDLVSRCGVRLIDLFDEKRLESLLERNITRKNAYLKQILGSASSFNKGEILAELKRIGAILRPYVADVSEEVSQAIESSRTIVFEGAQGCLLDVHHGTYPFVTSSNTVAGAACVSAGFGPQYVDYVLGICKAYCTRVGSGPFPTEDIGSDGGKLREIGKEFGTVTGRPRRCGWFDAVAVRRAVRLNGIESLFITKLDVLTGFPKVKLCTSYRVAEAACPDMPASWVELQRVGPLYEELPGWNEDITGVRTYSELPPQAMAFLERIQQVVGRPVGGFSVGPDRKQTIICCDRLRGFAGTNS